MARKFSSKNPDPYDVSVGKRIKFLRVQAGHSQEAVGKVLGLTFQQVQKYESGKNRCGPSRLIVMAKLFKVPMADFFDEKPASKDGVDYASLMTTRNRQQIFQKLVKLDDARVETAVLALLDKISA